MSTATKTRLDVVPLTSHIGAEIRGIDLREKPDDETVKAIYQAWLDHLVIIFPGRNCRRRISSAPPAFSARLARYRGRPKYLPKGYSSLLPGIMMISNIRENGEPIGALPDGEMMFHHDMIHAAVPTRAPCSIRSKSPRPAATRCSPAATPPTTRSIQRSATAWRAASPSITTTTAPSSRTTPRRPRLRRKHPSGVPHPRGNRPQGGLRQPPDDGRHRGHAAGGSRAAAGGACSITPRNPNSSTSTSGASATCCCGTTAARRTPAAIFPRPSGG